MRIKEIQIAAAPVNPGPVEQYKLHFKYTWIMYRLFCFNNGLAEGNLNNFRSWVHGSLLTKENQI